MSAIIFNPRPIGNNWGPCFVCGVGDKNTLHADRSVYVRSKEDGQAIVDMFEQGVRLDFREHEPNYIQVKFTACAKHEDRLMELAVESRRHVLEPDVAARLVRP